MKTKPAPSAAASATRRATPLRQQPLRRTCLALLIAACFEPALANPSMPQVVSGQASFAQQGNVFSITNTPNAIINWQSFSVNAGELTRFIQQSAGSTVLNRITGQDPSQILGALQSNGKVFLINPNGVLFGRDARVDVNGLVASSLAISNADFLAGKYRFDAGAVAGAVSNQGSIATPAGGQVILLAPNVENSGIITAPNGQVMLAAGHSVQLADAANPSLQVTLAAPADQAINLGQVIAQGGRIGMYGALVNQRGRLGADSAVLGENGKIVLKASGTTLLEAGSRTSATGAGKGGEIQVLGRRVGLTGDAGVDASGLLGGGSILVGGDYRGANAAVMNAEQSHLGAGATLTADASGRGDGGKVIVWSDNATRVFGHISARGGAQGGDGGFVETSGHYLDMQASVDVTAALGKTGQLLLDPSNIYIADLATTAVAAGMSAPGPGPTGSGNATNSGGIFAETSSSTDSLLTTAALQGALAGANVTVTTTNSSAGGAGFIKVVSPVGWGSPSRLTLDAAAGIAIDAGINGGPGGGLTLLSASGDITQSASLNMGVGGLTATALGGNVFLTDAGNTIAGPVTLQAAQQVSLTAATLNIAQSTSGADTNINTSGGALTVSGNVGSGGGLLNLTAGTAINLTSGAVLDSGNGAITLRAKNMDLLGTISAGSGSVMLAPATGVDVAVGIGAADATGTLGLTDAELRRVSTSSLLIVGDVGTTNSGNLAVVGNLDLGASLNGNLLLGAGLGDVTVNAGAQITVAGVLNLQTAPSAGHRISNAGTLKAAGVNLFSGQMTLAGGQFDTPSVSLGSVNSIELGSDGVLPGALVLGAADLDSLSGVGVLNIGVNSANATGDIHIGIPLSRTGNLVLSAPRNLTATAPVSVGGIFRLEGGKWNQSGGSLPAFFAHDFQVNTDNLASFQRVTGGDGGSSTPFHIADVYGLQGMAGLPMANHYVLDGDIDASGTVNWHGGAGFVPIGGSDGTGYAGLFDGASRAVNGLVINRLGENYVGMFGGIYGGVVKDLTLAGGSVSGDTVVGALVGEFAFGTVFNVHSSAVVNGLSEVGGLAGVNAGTINLSSASGDVSGAGAMLGGLVGNNAGSVLRSMASGAVNGDSSVGGLVGSNTGSISASQAKGVVVGVGENVGGLVGDSGVGGSIATSAATGSASGERSVGGLVGRNAGLIQDAFALGAVTGTTNNSGITHENLGGLVGVIDGPGGNVGNVYSAGFVSGSGFANVGGVVGFNAGNLSTSYWNTDTSGQNTGAGGIGVGTGVSTVVTALTNAQSMERQNFAGFDFDISPVWRIYEGRTGPLLKSLLKPLQANISATASREYDGTESHFAGSIGYTGLSGGDTAANGALDYTTAARNVGTYTLDGLWSTKYDISYTGATSLDITPRALTVSIGGSKVYDGSLGFSGAVYTLNNLVSGDSVTVGGSASFADKNAGTNKAVSAEVGLSGADAGNYSYSSSASGLADITPATVSIVNVNGLNKIYDGGTAAAIDGASVGLSGVLTTDSGNVILALGASNFSDKNVGTGKTINMVGASLTGSEAGNYVLASANASTSADITPRTLNVSYAGVNKVYDGGTGASFTSTDDRVGGDILTVSASASFGDKNVGPSKTIAISGASLTGTDALNYMLAATGGSATAAITARLLSVTYTGVNRIYNGGVVAGVNVAGDDRVAGDTLSVSGFSGSFGDKNVGTGKAISVSGATLSGNDAGNYVLSSAIGPVTADITPATLSIASLTGLNRTYDGGVAASVSGTVGGLFGSDDVALVSGTSSFGDKNVGTGKTITMSGATLSGTDAGNYVLTSTGGTATADITQATLSIASLTGESRVYDGTTAANVSGTVSGVFGSDDVALVVASSFGDKNVGTGKLLTVSGAGLTGADAGNYTLASTGGSTTADITPRTLNVTYSGVNKVYDGNTVAALTFSDDRVAGDVLGVGASASFGDKNVGTGKTVSFGGASLTGADAGNYLLAANSGNISADITPRALTVTYNGIDKVYDGTMGASLGSTDDRVAGDLFSVSASGNFADRNVGSDKAVSVSGASLFGADAGNYTVADGGATTASITPRALTVSYNGVNKVYDGGVGASFSVAGDDRVFGDSVGVSASASFADKNVGPGKTVSISGATLSGAHAGNYTLAGGGSTTANITPRTLTVTYTGVDKVYDGGTAAAFTSSDDRVGGDDISPFGTASFADKNAGAGKLVSISGVSLAGGDAPNYVLAGGGSATVSADITARNLNLSYSAGNKVYDGGVAASVSSTDDRVAGDQLSVSQSASFSDKNAGANKKVTLGSVLLSGPDGGNYVAIYSPALLASISQANLFLSGATVASRVYDGTLLASVTGGSLSGVLGQDQVFASGGQGSFADKNVGTGKLVKATGFVLGGADAANYALASASVDGTADITARTLNLRYSALGKVYDGGTLASVSGSDDRLAGDALSVSQSASFSDKNVGNGKLVTVSNVALGGADAGNYVVAVGGQATADITPATLTLSGVSAASRAYDGSTVASVSASLGGVIGGDTVVLDGGVGNFSDKNVGSGKSVAVSGFGLSGADAGNYLLSFNGAGATADITQKLRSTWVGTAGGLWSDARNWDGGVVPDGANVLAVNLSGSGVVDYSAAAGSTIIGTLSGSQGLSITGGSLTLGSQAAGTGSSSGGAAAASIAGEQSLLTGSPGLSVSGGSLLLNGGLTVDDFAQSGGVVGGSGNLSVRRSFSQSAGSLGIEGVLAVVQAAGDLSFAKLSAASVTLAAAAGRISQSGPLVTASLDARAQNGITLTDSGNRVGGFSASNSGGGGIALTNTSNPGTLLLGTLSSGSGDIVIDNTGGIETHAISTSGNVSVTAHSPIQVEGAISGSDIDLSASTEIVLGSASSLAAQQDVSMAAGTGIALQGSARVSAGGNISLATTTGNISAESGVTINGAGTVSLSAPLGTLSTPSSIFTGSAPNVVSQITDPDSPVTLVQNSTINLINTVLPALNSGTLLAALTVPAAATDSDTTSTDTSSTGTSGGGKEKKSDDNIGHNKEPGMKNEPVKKMYCN